MTDAPALLDVAVEAARAAGAVLLERFEARPEGVTTKSTPTDLVSEADLAAERAIRDVLAARRPDDAILGEEGDDVPGTSGLRWVVDPLDGTVNYLFGHARSGACSVACEGRAAAILDPVRDELFTVCDGERRARRRRAARGLAARRARHRARGDRLRLRRRRARRGRPRSSRACCPQVRDIRRTGSAALDLA